MGLGGRNSDPDSGQVVGRVAGQVTALSWLGDLAVEELYQTGQAAVVDWRTGETLWTNGPSERVPSGYVGAIALLGTDDLALTVRPRGVPSGPWNLWLIAPGHAPKLLNTNVGPY